MSGDCDLPGQVFVACRTQTCKNFGFERNEFYVCVFDVLSFCRKLAMKRSRYD